MSVSSPSLLRYSSGPAECSDGWREVPRGLVFYDYLGHNPAKGGFFRSGAMNSGDGIAIGWLGHALFETGTGQRLFPRRVPSFFESFPVVLLDDLSVVRAHHPLRRSGLVINSRTSVTELVTSVAFHAACAFSGGFVSNVGRNPS